MKANMVIRVGLALMVLSLTSAIFAQTKPGCCAGPRMGANRYDSSTEMTAKGTVEEVQQITGRRGWGGTHLTLKTDSATYDVHVGPSTFLKQEGFSFEKGDKIEVTGSKTTFQQGDAIIAREIKKGDKTLKLRDEKGFPMWSRRGRGPGAPAK